MSMHTHHSGFTLIEMIVSVGLFAAVMLVSTGAYLSLIGLDRKARATNDLVTNLSFGIDAMERSMRSGNTFQCGGDSGGNCQQGSSVLVFVNDQGQTVTYRLDSTHHAIGQCFTGSGSCNDSTNQILTDPRITVSNLKFYVRGVGSGDNTQPWVLFTVTGTLTPDAATGPVTFTIQSTASQRSIEL